jgi:predicted GNAT family N-acyltransferase
MTIHISIGNWNMQQAAARLVREQVFITEQQIPLEMAMDKTDDLCLHAVATGANGTPIGTARLLPDGHIGRLAVLASARGTGVGARLVQCLLQAAKERGDKRVIVNANSQVVGFYERLGFEVISAEYVEAGIKHIDMEYCFELSL